MRVRRQNQAILQPGLQLSAPDREARGIFIRGKPTANQASKRGERREAAAERQPTLQDFSQVQYLLEICRILSKRMKAYMSHEQLTLTES